MKTHLLAHRVLYGALGAVISLVIAIVYFFITPKISPHANEATRFILTYAHSLCWLLISLASTAYAFKAPPKVTNFTAYAALLVYIVFIVNLFIL